MSEERIFAPLEPPAGGWRRLQARRRVSHTPLLGVPFAAAATLALVVAVLRPQPQELHLPWTAGRLVTQPAERAGLRAVSRGQVNALPSDDPLVQFYWLQDGSMPPSASP